MNKPYINRLSQKHKITRLLWNITWSIFASWLPRKIGNRWKKFLLRSFGAKISPTAKIHPSVKIYYPSNLIMEDYSCLASNVDCYNVDIVKLGKFVTISKGAFLCTASHDITSQNHELITAPINIEDNAWVAVEAFIGMGVTIGEGAVVGARAAVFKDVEPWTVVGGNPAKFIKKRIINN